MRYPLAFLLILTVAAGGSKPARYHFELGEVALAPTAPAELGVKARNVLNEAIAARPDVVQLPENTPDPAKDPDGFRRVIDARGIRAYALKLKIDRYERALGPGPKGGNVLTIAIGVSLVGSQLPGEALALAGSGGSTVAAEVGATLRPGEEEETRDDALKDALTHALDDAIAKLSTKTKAKRTRK